MRAPETRSGGPPAPATANNPDPAKPQDPHHDNAARDARVAYVWGVAYGPTAGRGLWWYAVTCPRGHGVHLHRGGPPRQEGHPRTPPSGEAYVVLARTILPAADVVA